MNYPPPQFLSNFNPHYSHIFNPFGVNQATHNHNSYHVRKLSRCIPEYEATTTGRRTSNTSRIHHESSTIGSASSVSQEQLHRKDHVDTADWSESSLEENQKKEGRVYWREEENLRSVSAWLKWSNDPIQEVDRRGDIYWKNVIAEYNLHAPKERWRTYAKLKKPLEQDYTFNYQIQWMLWQGKERAC